MKEQCNIVITGASSGIGKATALEMANEGHRFYLIGRNESRLQNVTENIEKQGSEAFYSTCDVGNDKEVKNTISVIKSKLGLVDILFANAGVGYFGNLEDITVEQFNEQFNTNVKGVFLFIKYLLPSMKERNSGQIIVTSSNLGLNTSARAGIYAATKHAVQAMISCLREELKGTNIKAATINPGSVSTPWFDGKDVDRSKMLTALDVAKIVKLIINQSETSNIDHILLLPGKN